MLRKILFDGAALTVTIIVLAVPAAAGVVIPAPVAGVGVGALVVMAIGYRALRKRIDG
jgi:hypothetical protein